VNKKSFCHPTVFSAVFAILVAIGNWHYSKTVVQGAVTTTLQFSGAFFAIIISIIGAIFFGRRIYLHARQLRNTEASFTRVLRLVDWSPCLILLPLLFRSSTTLSETSASGVITRLSWGYGSELSFQALVAACLVIAIFQISRRPTKF